ncbi:MAG TPA: 2-C-methyl-D-erythritol 4-phosphate cytidylyltransferase [Actinomycetota bacterium]
MKAVVLLAAAGRGDRLGAALPKALVPLAGRSLLAHCMQRIDAAPVSGVIVAAPPGDRLVAREAERWTKLVSVVEGGLTRQASIAAALAAVPPGTEAVVCHDAARPLAAAALFAAVLGALDAADGAVPVLRPTDTVKRLEGETVVETIDRNGLGLAQTPQAFLLHALETAHRAAADEGFEATDDAALVERAGFKVVAVPGHPSNIKVTHPGDLRVADHLARG